MSRFETAREAYRQIVQAILEIEEAHNVCCDLPEFLEIDGMRFFKHDLLPFPFSPKDIKEKSE